MCPTQASLLCRILKFLNFELGVKILDLQRRLRSGRQAVETQDVRAPEEVLQQRSCIDPYPEHQHVYSTEAFADVRIHSRIGMKHVTKANGCTTLYHLGTSIRERCSESVTCRKLGGWEKDC